MHTGRTMPPGRGIRGAPAAPSCRATTARLRTTTPAGYTTSTPRMRRRRITPVRVPSGGGAEREADRRGAAHGVHRADARHVPGRARPDDRLHGTADHRRRPRWAEPPLLGRHL